jgi:hypothetical protein
MLEQLQEQLTLFDTTAPAVTVTGDNQQQLN